LLAFIDESGDPGRKLAKGSSRYFVVAVVTFDDNDVALECDKRISLLRRQMGLSEDFEFHFNSNSHRTRIRFLESVAPYPFFYHGFVLDKDPRKLVGEGFKYKESLYKYVCRLVLTNARPYLNQATVVIDKSGGHRFQRQLATYLRKQIQEEGRQVIKKVKSERSNSNNLLQLADYVASTINRRAQGKWGAAEYHRYLAAHEISLQVWPKRSTRPLA
jgi:hypothetical protein